MLSKSSSKEGTNPRPPSILVTDTRNAQKASSHLLARPHSTAAALLSPGSSVIKDSSRTIRRPSGSLSRSHTIASGVPATQGGESAASIRNVSLDSLLANVDQVPSVRRRSGATPQHQHPKDVRINMGPGVASGRRVVGQNIIPPRSSEKLVLLPIPSTTPKQSTTSLTDLSTDDNEDGGVTAATTISSKRPTSKRSNAERLPKSIRDERSLPRVTAYCTANAYRLKGAMIFLEKVHEACEVEIYDEVLYGKYYLPLVRGDEGDEGRVRSNDEVRAQLNRANEEPQPERGSKEAEDNKTLENEQMQQIGSSALLDDTGSEDHLGSPVLDKSLIDISYERHNQSHPLPSINESDEQLQAGTTSNSISNGVILPTTSHQILEHTRLMHIAEIFVLNYGVVVFWNFTERQERDILADLSLWDGGSLVSRRLRDDTVQIEDFHFEYSFKTRSPRIYNDMITLRSGYHMIKLAMSHAIAQSVKMSVFEQQMDTTMEKSRWLPAELALRGELGMTRGEVIKMSGRLFRLRVDVNLSSNVLDTPNIFWDSEPQLYDLYSAVRGNQYSLPATSTDTFRIPRSRFSCSRTQRPCPCTI